MRKVWLTVVLTLISISAVSAQQRFVAYLTGAQQVPGNFSTAKGTCKIVLNAAQTQITVNCTYSGLGSTASSAHIHGNGAVGVNAPIIFDFGAVSGTSGSINPAPLALTPAQLSSMRSHMMYVNIHSSNFPDGEIRGQIKQTHTVSDNEGDGRSDPTIFRQTSNEFWSLHSLNGGVGRTALGTGSGNNFLNLSGDFDGDGRFDPLLISVSGTQFVWTIFQTDTGTVRTVTWGNTSLSDTLAFADYDGDGKLDVAVFRRSTGDWWIIESSTGSTRSEHWGVLNDFPAVGDYDGDGKADLTAVRVESGQRVWYIRNSSTGSLRRETFGSSTTDGVFFFVPFDWDGDSRQDVFVNRSVAGQREFWILRSSDGGVNVVKWGLSTDLPLFGDYDGDGKTDIVARRNQGGTFVWYVLRSSDFQLQAAYWGITGDQLVDGEDLSDDDRWIRTEGEF